MANYYNEYEPYAAEWLRNLIAAGHLPAGDVDTRSIVDVQPDDLAGYVQCHFFAGIGGWALAARLAGWPDDRELWTGSCPCQPFSAAGKGLGHDDERHLWPHQLRLLRARRPAVWMGEQVAAAVGKDWLDGVLADLEGIGYAGRAAVVPACAVDAPHRRDRLWVVAERGRAMDHGQRPGLEGHAGHGDDQAGWSESDRPTAAAGHGSVLADTNFPGTREEREQRGGQLGRAGGDQGACAGAVADAGGERRQQESGGPHGDESQDEGRAAQHDHVAASHGQSRWAGAGWIIGHDGKARRVGSDLRGVVDGLPEGLGRLCADYYAEAAEGVIAHAETAEQGPGEVLREVRDRIATEAVWQEPRGFFGIRQAEVLLPYLRELEGRLYESWTPGSVAEDAREVVRGMRVHARPACPPQGRRLHEQRPVEYPNALHALSQLLARAAGSAFEAMYGDAKAIPLLGHGISARVGRLRAYGNAIVPEVAAEVIAAYMECSP